MIGAAWRPRRSGRTRSQPAPRSRASADGCPCDGRSNVPRPLFSRRGLARYHALEAAGRERFLAELSAPSYPPDRRLDETLSRAEDEGRFEVVERVGDEEQVVCATGFLRGYDHDPLLSDLVEAHGLATAGGRIVLADDATVPALTDATRTLALAGVAAQWAFPAADTLAGARYAARGLARRVLRVLHAEGPPRGAAARRDPGLRRDGRARRRAARLVAARARGVHGRDRRRARRRGLALAPALPAGRRRAAARPGRAGCDLGRAPRARDRRPGPRRDRRLRRHVALRAGARPRGAAPCPARLRRGRGRTRPPRARRGARRRRRAGGQRRGRLGDAAADRPPRRGRAPGAAADRSRRAARWRTRCGRARRHRDRRTTTSRCAT